MTRRRFYARPEALDKGLITLAAEEARHLRDVLRLKAGDEAFVFDGEGTEYACIITETGRGKTHARLEVREKVAPPCLESRLALTLAVALLKGEKFDLVVQKATELGASRIIPVTTARADVRLRDASDAARRVTRWHRLALEACKQSGRARVPDIESPTSFSSLLEREKSDDARVMFAERLGCGLVEAFGQTEPTSMIALVGPEGGWEDDEIAQARSAGWEIVTLGGRTLRAETAAIAVTALLQHRYGDLK
jgi:16S rRNA (uracil1498-N3)-methyltransferase